MSTASLMGLRDYLYGTLSIEEMVWLVEELKGYVRKESRPEPYTIEEIHRRIAESERDFAEERYFSDDEVFADLEGKQ